jgi:uracil phosphoribosyltransferase
MSPEVADMLQGYKEVRVVTATIESGRDSKTGFLTPGIGQFDTRYSEGR